MSEWKNKIKRQTIESEEYFCARTGWGISDGIVELISVIKKRRRERKAKKLDKN